MFPELSLFNLYQPPSWLKLFGAKTYENLFRKCEQIHKKFNTIEGDVRFSLEDLKHFDAQHLSDVREEIIWSLLEYWTCSKIEFLNIKLKQNPPREKYKNPALKMGSWFATNGYSNYFENQLMNKVITEIDLPGSKYNPAGNGSYYSELFYHMFFGNYSDFNDHIKKLSQPELEKTLNTREGYPQFSPVFAPIIGRRMMYIEQLPWLTKTNIRDIRTMWNGENENAHYEILERLLELGADVNAYDFLGNTALDHASLYPDCDKVVPILLKFGADPNLQNTIYKGTLHLYVERLSNKPEYWSVIDLLLNYNAKPKAYEEGRAIRELMDGAYSLDLVAKVKELCPKKNVCELEKCKKSAIKKCKACDFVVYCSPACQKLDWKFHKPTCKKKREEIVKENSV